MTQLETIGKRAAIVSLLAITALQLTMHPDMTAMLGAVGAGALAVGWIAARGAAGAVMSLWLIMAPLAPVLVNAAGRQGPVADIVWMAGLTGSLLRTAPWSRWNLPPAWALLLGGWALALSLGWPVLVMREADFDLRGLRDLSMVNSWAMLPAPHVIAWTLFAVQVPLVGLFWLEYVHGVLDRTGRLPRVVHALWLSVTAASVVAVMQGTVDISFLNVDFWIEKGRASGTMLDANAYATAAALSGPIGFLALRRRQAWGATAGAAILALHWVGVWMSESRTALLGAACGMAGIGAGLLLAPDERASRGRWMFLGAAAVAGIVLLVAGARGPLQRVAAIATPAGLASLWHRDGYGTIAIDIIREYPLTGVGIGAYRYLAPDYERAANDTALPLDNAQNWWRHQAAELGLFGGVLVLLWSAVAAWSLLSRTPPPPHALAAWTLRGLLVGVGLASLVGMPTQNPVVLLLVLLVFAWLHALVTAAATNGTSNAEHTSHSGAGPYPTTGAATTRRYLWATAFALAIAYAAGHVILARGPLSVANRASRFQRPYVEGAYPAEVVTGGDDFRWTDDQSRFVLPSRGRHLIMRLWAHHPDITERPVRVSITTPCGRLFERNLDSPDAITLGVAFPPGPHTLDATISVSRTWSPSEHGSMDRRRLGVAVITDLVDRRELAFEQDHTVEWPGCVVR